MKIKLRAVEHTEDGGLGWLLPAIRGGHGLFGPISYPRGIAHDILEHHAFESVADEIEAHGAIYWIRYQAGTVSLDDIAIEWINLVHGLGAEAFLPNTPKTRALDSTVEADLDSIIESGTKFCKNEFRDEEWIDYNSAIDRIVAIFRQHFRIGYRKAARKYRDFTPDSVAYTFSNVEKEFERFQPEFEGQEIVVKIDLQACTCQVVEIEVG